MFFTFTSFADVPWQITGFLFSAVFELVMLALVRARLRSPASGPFCLALLLNAFWALGYAVDLALPTLEGKQLAFQLRCSVLCFYAPAWLELAHRMTRGRPLLRGWTAAGVLLVPLVSLALLWFPGPGQSPLLRHSFWIDTSGGLAVLRNALGPMGQVYYFYNYAVWVVIFLLFYPRRSHTRWERRGRLTFLCAAFIGWTADLLHLFGVTSPAGLNYAPMLFPITSTLIAYALLRHRMLNLAPVARSALIERLEDRIVVLDAAGRVVDCNEAAARTLGLARRDAVGGRAAGEVFAAWPGLVAFVNGSGDDPLELAIGPAVFEASSIPVLEEGDKRPRARVLVLRDITRRKEAENQLRQAKDAAEAAERAQSRFLATMSHELRTPLNGVVGFIQLLKNAPLDSEQGEYLRLLDQSTRSLLVIINDVLDYSKIAADQMDIERVVCGPRALADEAQRLFQPTAAGAGLTLETRVAHEVPEAVIGDPVRLQQILANLLGNAIKFTKEGGVILEIGAPREGVLEFRVTDTGIGIDLEQQARIFAPFSQADASTTRRFGGTGLGLSITRRLCELMGGSLTLTSEPGRGSTFVATVRAARTAPVAAVVAPVDLGAAVEAPRRRLRLLVLEDNAVNQRVMRAFLNRLGHEARFVDDGSKGLAALAEERFDALLMDIEMPVMDGYETTRRIREGEAAGVEGDARAYIIALTAHALRGERERCLAAGMDDFLSKPLSMDALKLALSRVP